MNALCHDSMERFRIHSVLEIGHILKSIQKRNLLLRIRFDHTTKTAVTTLLDVDIANRRVVIDQVSLDAQNMVTQERRVGFETVMDKIGISFISEGVRPCLFENTPALVMPFPLNLLRFEKRETCRIPVANGALRIPLAAGKGQRYAMAEICDLSVNGVSFFDSAFLLGNAVGRVYPDSFLYLPDMELMTFDLEVRNAQPVSLQDGQVRLRLGCSFLSMPSSRMALLQRFIQGQEPCDDSAASDYPFF